MARMPLWPYDGSHRSLPDGCPKVLSTFSGDESARVTYAFNSLGFRGDEFEPAARRHIFVCGCSMTFGLGLDYADAWAPVFRRGYAGIHDTCESAINLQNFASSGCSNGYITRTLIRQCARFQPSLALAMLTFSDRAELVDGGRSYNIGRWCLLDSFDRGAEADGHVRELRQTILRKAKAHYDLYTPLSGDQDLLKNALLLQLFFESRRIPFLIGVIRPGNSALPNDELLGPWHECLDRTRVFSIPLRECLADQSAARGHPGPAGSRAIAEAFLSRYKETVGEASPGVRRTSAVEVDEPPEHPRAEDSSVYPLF